MEESQVQDSERVLVPLGSGLAGPPPVSSGGIDMPWLRVDGLVSRIVDRILLRDRQRQTDPLDGQAQP